MQLDFDSAFSDFIQFFFNLKTFQHAFIRSYVYKMLG